MIARAPAFGKAGAAPVRGRYERRLRPGGAHDGAFSSRRGGRRAPSSPSLFRGAEPARPAPPRGPRSPPPSPIRPAIR